MGIDYSFLRLKPSFDEAKNVGDPAVSDFNYHDIIALLPTEKYTQITNLPNGIAFDGDFQVLLIDCNENELSDITAKVGICENTDTNGVNQIAFELANLGLDFGGRPVYLKFIHTTGSEVWYSNAFCLTSIYERESTRFDYKDYSVFKGTDYRRFNFTQSIRLKAYFDRPADDTEISDYYQITRGKTVSARALLKESSVYKFDYVTPHVFRAANIMLISNVVYIDGVRMSNKTTLKSSERLNKSNLMVSEFTINKNENDTFIANYQIFEPLQIVTVEPTGVKSINFPPIKLRFFFNKPTSFIASAGLLYVKDVSDNSIVLTKTQAQMTPIAGNGFSLNITGEITLAKDYYVTIDSSMFQSGDEIYEGINDKTTWTFSLVNPDFLAADFNGIDFLT